MQLNVINFDGKSVGKATLNDAIFGIEPRSDILHRVVQYQLANRRAGTHKAKSISDISGSTKKPFKQKGTGHARQGSTRSPHMRGGAVIFGPVVRSHEIDLPKKIRALGLKMALSSKIKEGKIVILDSEAMKAPKTSEMTKVLEKMNVKNVLFVGGEAVDTNFKKSVANIPHVDVLPTIGLNVYDILKHDNLVLTQDAIQKIEERLGA